MSFFLRNPKFWAGIWAIFTFGGLIIAIEGVIASIDLSQMARGLIGIAVGLMMIVYIRKHRQFDNAPNY